MTVKQLRAEAKSKGLKGYSKLRKADLQKLLGVKPELTVKELKAEAKARGLKGYSKLRKAELVALLKPVAPVTPAPVVELPEETIIQIAISELPVSIDYAKSMTRYLTGRHTSRDLAVIDTTRLEAIKRLRDESETERQWHKWADRYVVEMRGRFAC